MLTTNEETHDFTVFVRKLCSGGTMTFINTFILCVVKT